MFVNSNILNIYDNFSYFCIFAHFIFFVLFILFINIGKFEEYIPKKIKKYHSIRKISNRAKIYLNINPVGADIIRKKNGAKFAPFGMPLDGVEPSRYRYHWILSPARLPIPPQRH